MSKGKAKKNLHERTHLIQVELQARHRKLAGDIQKAKEGKLDIHGLNKLKVELEKPVKLSETLFIQIEDCHPSTGTYQRALPKGYQSDVTAINNAIQAAMVENDVTAINKATQAAMVVEDVTAINKATQAAMVMEDIEAEILARRKEIIEAFNAKPKHGIQKIKEICTARNIDMVEEHIANFFHKEKQNLDLEAVGDYISGPEAENKAVLQAFTSKIDLTGQSFTQALRSFLKTFKLPGEAQKIDRLVESFSGAYCQQNPGGNIANKDAGYVLAFQAIMLNTDLHNPSIAADRKMDFSGLKKNLRGCNNKADFDESFLQDFYDDIKANPFELNFVKIDPGYTISSSELGKDSTFNRLDTLIQSSNLKAHHLFPGVGENIKATVSEPKSWLNILTGYNGTITLSDESSALVTIQVYNPSFFSKWLFGEEPKVVIQPVKKDGKVTPEAIDLAAKVAANFETPVTSVKATYEILKTDLQEAYNREAKCSTPKEVASNRYSLWSSQSQSKAELPDQEPSLEQQNPKGQ